jgi:ectoine hydroxylase-related dioxygenase (phytanoyl-CoA dioxygenase family)
MPDVCFVLNSMWMLTEFTRENGGTVLLPCSQRAPTTPRKEVQYKHLVYAEGPPGSVVFFNDSTWHGGGANVTADKHRIGLGIAYFPSWLDPGTTNWRLMRRSVCDRMPPLVQQMNKHVVEDDVEMTDARNYDRWIAAPKSIASG